MPIPRSSLGFRPQPNAVAAASRTARSRSCFRFFRRNASGSSFSCVSELIQVGLAGEVIGGGGERSVGPLSQWGADRMECGELVGHFIEHANPGGAGIVVMKFPGRERAVAASTAFDFDHAGRPEVGPCEFFLARPDELDRPAGLASQPGRFNGRLAGMLAAVARPGVRHNDANRVISQPEGRGQFSLHPKWPLRSGPNGELAVLPLGDRRAGLKRSMSDVGDGIGLLQSDVRGGEAAFRSNRIAGPSFRVRLPPERPCRFMSSNRSLLEIGGPVFHSALIAWTARGRC